MVFCTNCGNEVKEGKFCTNCGQPLPEIQNIHQQNKTIINNQENSKQENIQINRPQQNYSQQYNQQPNFNQQYDYNQQYNYNQNRPLNKKSKLIGIILNVLFVGLGYAYVGKWGEGLVILVLYVLLLSLSFLIIPLIIAIGLWLYTLIKTNEMIDKYNQGLPY